MLKQSKLSEADANGPINGRSINLASTDGSWSALTHKTVNGTDYYATSYTATFDVGGHGNQPDGTATFVFTAHLYQTPTTIPYGNTTIVVDSNTLKFSIDVKNWPAFLDTANTLQYEVTVSSKGGDEDGSISNNGTDKKRVEMDGGALDLPTIAIIDSVSQNVNVGLSTKNAKSTVSFVFPSFSQTLYYDPTMTVYYSRPAGSSATMLNPAATFCFVLALVLLLA